MTAAIVRATLAASAFMNASRRSFWGQPVMPESS
jgi:hypothetical protein